MQLAVKKLREIRILRPFSGIFNTALNIQKKQVHKYFYQSSENIRINLVRCNKEQFKRKSIKKSKLCNRRVKNCGKSAFCSHFLEFSLLL
jgi:hypothetical protein